MQFPKVIFDIFNSLAFIALGSLIYGIILKMSNKKDWQPLELLGVFLGMWFVLPQFGLSVFWLSGACNYLWCALLYIGLLFLYLHIETLKINPFATIGICLLAFLAGGTNENSGAMMILMLALLSLRYYWKHRKLQIWKVFITLSGIAGWIFMMASPGSLARGTMELSLRTLIKNFYHTYINTWEALWSALIVLLVLVTLLISRRLLNRKIAQTLIIIMISCIAGIFCLTLSPEQPTRTLFGPSVLIIISIGVCLAQLKSRADIVFRNSGILLLFLAFIGSYMASAQAINLTWDQQQVRIKTIESYQGEEEIVVVECLHHEISEYNAVSILEQLNENEEVWFNRWIAAYYGIHRVRCENP